MTAKEIVTKVVKLYKAQQKAAKQEGYFHPALHASSREIRSLINDFEKLTGEEWDTHAESYLD